MPNRTSLLLAASAAIACVTSAKANAELITYTLATDVTVTAGYPDDSTRFLDADGMLNPAIDPAESASVRETVFLDLTFDTDNATQPGSTEGAARYEVQVGFRLADYQNEDLLFTNIFGGQARGLLIASDVPAGSEPFFQIVAEGRDVRTEQTGITLTVEGVGEEGSLGNALDLEDVISFVDSAVTAITFTIIFDDDPADSAFAFERLTDLRRAGPAVSPDAVPVPAAALLFPFGAALAVAARRAGGKA